MIPGLSTSLLVAFLLGFLAVRLAWPAPSAGNAGRVLRGCLAVGFGLGITSCWFFWWFCLVTARTTWFGSAVIPEVLAAAALGIVWRRGWGTRRSGAAEAEYAEADGGRLTLTDWLLGGLLLAMGGCALVLFARTSLWRPNGDYDAVAVWNMRARFFALGTDHWRSAFAASPGLPHPDYPLLIPATVGRLWKYMGNEARVGPAVVGFLFTLSSLGVVSASLAILRGRRAGLVAGIVVLGMTPFVALGAAQYADVPMAFFAVSAIALAALWDTAPGDLQRGLLILAGAAAAFCAWTKNEGLLFFVLFVAVRVVCSLRGGWRSGSREAAALLAGALPVLITLAYFKLRIAAGIYYLKVGSYAGNGPMGAFLDPATTAQKLRDASRYWTIARAMAAEIFRLGGRVLGLAPLLLLYLLVANTKRQRLREVAGSVLVLALMLAGYFAVYLTTPLILSLHLETSLSRLLLQLWPGSVFVIFMLAGGRSQDRMRLQTDAAKT